MTRPTRTLIHGSLHQRLYTGWIRRQNPWLAPPPFSRSTWFAYGFAAATMFCAVIVLSVMR